MRCSEKIKITINGIEFDANVHFYYEPAIPMIPPSMSDPGEEGFEEEFDIRSLFVEVGDGHSYFKEIDLTWLLSDVSLVESIIESLKEKQNDI